MSKDVQSFCKTCLQCQQESEGYIYALTMIDRYSRWPEATLLKDMHASTVAGAFVETWVTRFGAPEIITSDQGSQFESELFTELCKILGIVRVRITPYNPRSNGMIEHWHRDFKTALIAYEGLDSWTRILPMVMLGLLTRICSDIDASPAEVLFGTTLPLPGEFFSDHSTENDRQLFTKEIRQFLRS
ncbi:hypothetical protein TKK_0016543 [Trichogramma kaykai]